MQVKGNYLHFRMPNANCFKLFIFFLLLKISSRLIFNQGISISAININQVIYISISIIKTTIKSFGLYF